MSPSNDESDGLPEGEDPSFSDLPREHFDRGLGRPQLAGNFS